MIICRRIEVKFLDAFGQMSIMILLQKLQIRSARSAKLVDTQLCGVKQGVQLLLLVFIQYGKCPFLPKEDIANLFPMFACLIMCACPRRGQQAEHKAEQQGGKAAAHQDTF